MILCVPQLHEQQRKDLEQLVSLCQNHDQGTPAIYWYLLTQKRDTNNTVLYYQNERLIGMLSVYFFYENACEISLLVAPIHRRQGIARQLLANIFPLLQLSGMETLIFSSKAAFCDAWLPQIRFTYQHSEYHMERHSNEPISILQPLLTFNTATISDLSYLSALDHACFAEQSVNMIERFNYLLDNAEYRLLLARHQNKVVGKAHIQWRQDITMLSDIAVFPEYQGRGFGGEILAKSVNEALAQGKTALALDVETKNQSALNIYKRLGFKTTNTYDFWRINANDLYRLVITN